MPANLTFEQLSAAVEAGKIDTVLTCVVDMQGRLMGKRFHAAHFVNGGYEETHGCNYLLATDLNAPVIAESFNQAAAYLGIDGGFDGFRAFVQEFNDSLGIPRKLSDLGVEAHKLDDLIAMAFEDPSCGGNPVELTFDNLKQLFHAAI